LNRQHQYFFCSSIIHVLADQAAAIEMEKECSNPFEGFELTVTLLGEANYDRKENIK